MEQIKTMLDAVLSADTLASRQDAAKKLLSAVEAKTKVPMAAAIAHAEKASAAPVPDADAPVFKGGPAHTVVTIPPGVEEPPVLTLGPVSGELNFGTSEPVKIENIHYTDGSSATGPAPLPDHSPEGSPAIAGHTVDEKQPSVTVVTDAVVKSEPAPAPAAFTKTTDDERREAAAKINQVLQPNKETFHAA